MTRGVATALLAVVLFARGVPASADPTVASPLSVPLGPVDTSVFSDVLLVAGQAWPKMHLTPGHTFGGKGGAFAAPSGPCRLVGLDANGATLFDQSFAPNVSVQYSSEGLFNLALPITAYARANLRTIELHVGSKSIRETDLASGPPVARAVRVGPEAVELTWNGAEYPEASVDADDVNTLIRATAASGPSRIGIRTEATSLSIDFSNGVTSTTVVVPVASS